MLDIIQKRRSIRRYEDKPVEDEKLKEILFAAMCSPSGYHKDPWEFIVVRKEESRTELARSTNYASFVKDAPLIIVIAAREEGTELWLEDSSVVAAHIYLEATNQGLGTCWVQTLNMVTPDGNDSEVFVRELLKIPETHRILCLMPIGYPAEELPPHDESRYIPEKIHDETW